MRNVAALGLLVLMWAGVLVVVGAVARVAWWLMSLGWAVL